MKLTSKHWVVVLITPLMVALDQATKIFIHSTFQLYQAIEIVPDYFNIIYVRNTGLAFSLFTDRLGHYSTWIFLGITLVALGIIIHLFFQTRENAMLLPTALSFVLAGAFGNLIDRLHWGYVVDFIQWHYGEHYWPTFNVADISIAIGIVFLVIDSFRPQAAPSPETKAGGPTGAK